jgi:hypothetical protein
LLLRTLFAVALALLARRVGFAVVVLVPVALAFLVAVALAFLASLGIGSAFVFRLLRA